MLKRVLQTTPKACFTLRVKAGRWDPSSLEVTLFDKFDTTIGVNYQDFAAG